MADEDMKAELERLRNENLRVAHERILILEDANGRVIKKVAVKPIVEFDAVGEISARQLLGYQLSNQGIAHRDEIGSRRVQWVGKQRCVTDEGPTVG